MAAVHGSPCAPTPLILILTELDLASIPEQRLIYICSLAFHNLGSSLVSVINVFLVNGYVSTAMVT